MSDPLRPGLQPVSHLKASPTTSSSRSTALPLTGQSPVPRPSSRLRLQRPSGKEDSIDPASEKATLALIRRVLCPQTNGHGTSSPQSPEELLPPLTSSNDVDRQVYALIAIIIKEFLYSWYSKITPDQALVNEVLQVIAHCTRALEQRIRQIDVSQLILDEVPALVEVHILSYRQAKQQSYLSGLPTSHRALYHQLNPHPGLSPVPDPTDPDTIGEQSENEAIYRRLLVNGTLSLLLPTEDLENSSLRTLIGDVLADLILGKEVAGRICEGRFFWETTTKLITSGPKQQAEQSPGPSQNMTTSQLERFGLLYNQDDPIDSQPSIQSPISTWIWSVLQNIYLFYVVLRFIATGLFRVASSPSPRASHGAGVSFPAATPETRKEGTGPSSDSVACKRPVLDYRMLSMASRLLGISQRMPWLTGLFALTQHFIVAGPGRLGDTDSVLDRFLRETIQEYVLTPTLLPNLLLATRTALFPANARPQSPGVSVVNTRGTAPGAQASVQSSAGGKALATAANSSPALPQKDKAAQPIQSESSGNLNSDKLAVENGQDASDHPPRALSPAPPMAITTKSPTPAINATKAPSSSAPITGSEKKQDISHPNPEIAAIKRRCAASLLAVIPPSVARTFFAAPNFSSSGGVPGITSGYSSSLTAPGKSPLASSDECCGVQSRLLQGVKTTSPLSQATSTPSDSKSTGEKSLSEGSNGDQPDLEQEELDPERLYLLETIEEDLLDLFADEYCNKHLIYSILETVLSKILPELSERSVLDLMADRGVTPVPGGF